MNDLFSGDKFFGDVESVKDELKELERLRQNLQSSHEHSKTLDNAKAVKDHRSRMEADVTFALKKAKVLKVRLKALDRSNAANRSLPCCGPGSSSDRTRISVVNGLRKKAQGLHGQLQLPQAEDAAGGLAIQIHLLMQYKSI